MAQELRDKARSENSPYTKSEFETIAEIYSLLAQRAQVEEGSEAPRMTGETMSQTPNDLTESDAKGLQRQILEHFNATPTT